LKSHLYTTYYKDSKAHRLKELESCLVNNLNNSCINTITILNEGGDLSAFQSDKLKVIDITGRPTYQDFFKHINQEGGDNDIHIIANTDIYFDTQIAVLHHLDLEDSCLALSRWDTTDTKKPKLYDHNDSQDVWIFKGPIKSTLKADFPLGVPRCDNRLLYELGQAGYKVLNPAYSIKSYHIHQGQRALVYTEADNIYNISPPYRYLYPHNMFGLWQTIFFNLRYKAKLGRYRYDIKKTNNWWPVRLIRKSVEVLIQKKMPLIGYK
jgi:hypothetical protein